MNDTSKPYVRISSELHKKLANLAQKRGLIPHTSVTRRSLVNLGIETLLGQLANEEEERSANVK